jgi:replicative DNA helicase
MALYSLQVEKHVLSGLIQNPETIADIDGFVSERDFVAEPHGVIYSCLRSSYMQNERIDKVLLSQKIKNLGISFKENINIFDYIESISFAPVTKRATIEACQELVKLRALREVEGVCEEIKSHVNKSINQPLDLTISEVDALYGSKLTSFATTDEDENMYNRLLDLAEERGNNPIEEIGYSTPWPEFNRIYGGLRNKNLYVVAARAKAGKSTLLNEFASNLSRIHKMPVLFLDTEMSTEETQFRAAAAQSGVPMWYIETGNWRKNPEYVEKIRTKLKDISKSINVTHKYVGNMDISQIASLCRRWYLRKVGRGNKCLIIFDYIKIVGNDERSRKEYQEMGDKVDLLKKLAQELDIPILTACQNNREGVVGAREASEIVDDERSIGLSDRVTQFASVVWIFRRRAPEEITLDTPESGTHKLIEIVARHQGRDAAGHQDFIRRTFPDGKTKYVKNFINFNIQNFCVEERGSLVHSIERQNSQFLVTDAPNGDNRIVVQEETL